jgi:hypothetical protein
VLTLVPIPLEPISPNAGSSVRNGSPEDTTRMMMVRFADSGFTNCENQAGTVPPLPSVVALPLYCAPE